MVRTILSLLKLSGLPRWLQVSIYATAGLALGVGLVTARIANAGSYLLDDPKTCMNCHVMTDAYATWERGSHGRVAVCTDCHVPHQNVLVKWLFKSMDGVKHSTVFMMRGEPQVLELSEFAKPVVQGNCLRCHGDRFVMLSGAAAQRRCWDCHNNTHGEARSLSSSPHVLRPRLPDAGLEWMKKEESSRD